MVIDEALGILYCLVEIKEVKWMWISDLIFTLGEEENAIDVYDLGTCQNEFKLKFSYSQKYLKKEFERFSEKLETRGFKMLYVFPLPAQNNKINLFI
jgi:hypothetical protein